MKTRTKFSIRITGIFLLLILALAGCQDPVSDFSLTEGTSIRGPAGLHAEKLTGGVLLTWQTVPDAAGYQVYRYNKTTYEEKELTPTSGGYLALYYLDLVGWNNVLAEGSYTYKVVAVSGGSGNQRAAVDGLVFNGVSTIDVTYNPANATANPPTLADIPARTDSSWITLADLPDAETHGDVKRLVFQTTPNLRYNVKVALGGAIGGTTYYYQYDDVGLNPASATPFIKDKYVSVPQSGGTTTVEITAEYRNSDYYTGTVVKRRAITQEAGLDKPDYFSATRRNSTDQYGNPQHGDPQYVDFQWNEVAGATDYKIYKAETDGGYTVKSDWKPVAFSVAPIQRSYGWEAVETLTPATEVVKEYVYILVAEAGSKKSPASEPVHVGVVPPAVSFNTSVVYDAADTPQIQLTWTANADSYELARAVVTFLNGDEEDNSNIVSALAFDPITTLTAADYLQGKGVKVDTTVTARTSYAYRLVAIKNGVRSLPAYRTVNQGPFSYKSYLEADYYSGSPSYHGTAVTLTDHGTYWGDDPVIQVYRKKADQPENAYARVAGKDISAANITDGFGSYTFTDAPPLDGTGYYDYKFVVVKGTREFDNYIDDTSYPYNSVSTPAAAYASVGIAEVNYINIATNVDDNIVLSFYGSNLAKAPIRVMLRQGTSGNFSQRNVEITYEGGDYRYVISTTGGNTYQISAISGTWTGAPTAKWNTNFGDAYDATTPISFVIP
jgi:hypothetical protein